MPQIKIPKAFSHGLGSKTKKLDGTSSNHSSSETAAKKPVKPVLKPVANRGFLRGLSPRKNSISDTDESTVASSACSSLPCLDLHMSDEFVAKKPEMGLLRQLSGPSKKTNESKMLISTGTENTSPKKSPLSQFKLAPPRMTKRYEFEYRSGAPRLPKTKLIPEQSPLQRSSSDRKLDLETPPSAPKTSSRRKASIKSPVPRSPAKKLNSLDDFMSEYASIMDDFPEKSRKGKKKKSSQSVIGW